MASRGLRRRLGSTRPLGDASGQASSSLRSPREQVRGHACEDGTRERWPIGGKQLGGEQEVAPCFQLTFELITKMPLKVISELLSKILQKLKICKYKSCLIFKALQLSQ
jgi:hypothetical protein